MNGLNETEIEMVARGTASLLFRWDEPINAPREVTGCPLDWWPGVDVGYRVRKGTRLSNATPPVLVVEIAYER